MNAEELLLQLKDIQSPLEPAWWLLAPAYLVIASVIAALLAVVYLLVRQRRAGQMVKLAEWELQAIKANYLQNQDTRQLAHKVSRWLKQVSLLAFPDLRLESASGETWLEFLDQSLGEPRFSTGSGRLFGGAVYRRDIKLDAAEVFALCERWLIQVKPHLQQRSKS